MNKPTKPFSLAIVLTIGLIGQTWATPITVQSGWQGKGSLQTLVFTFDDTAADGNSDPIIGDYVNAISSVNFSFAGTNYTLDDSRAGQPESNEILINATPNYPGASVQVFAALNTSDGSQFNMYLRIETWPSPTNDSIQEIFYPANEPDSFLALNNSDYTWTAWFYPDDEMYWHGLTPVPLSNTAFLFSSSLIVLVRIKRKKKN